MSVPLPDVLARVRRRSLPLLLLCAALLPLLVAAEALGWRAASGPPDLPAAADTTVLFGPKQFNATSAGALYVEQFSTTVDHAATYVLEVTNGTASGTNRVVNGAVKLNGTTLVSASNLQSDGRVITRAVWPADGANTLQVEAKGNSALYMSVRLLRIIPQAQPLYRHGWRKTTAAYQVFHDSFNTPRGVSMPGRLYVEQGSGADSVFLNGQRVYPACVPDMSTTCTLSVDPFYNVSLQAVNALRVEMGGPAGSAVVVRVEAVDTMAPVIDVTAPAQQLITRESTVTVAGTVTDDSPPVTLTIDGDTVPVDGTTGAFSHPVALAHDGTHTIQLVARDGATSADGGIIDELDPEGGTPPQGNVAQLVRTVIRDSQAPALALSAPADGAVVDAATVLVQGTVTDATALTVNVNGIPVTPDATGAFSLEISLSEGANFVTASATDAAGNVSTVTRQVTRSAPPALAVSAPVDGSVTQSASIDVQGTATGAAPLSLTLNGGPVALGADGSFSQSVPLSVGANTLTLVLTDGVGRTVTATRGVTREAGEPLPPDPSTVAPALDRTVPTTLHGATEFLYSGADPIQTGVAPGTIVPVRASVVRGRVLGSSGAALPGVTITVQGHPELGQTKSRADGAFDLVVNGGGVVTLNYARPGYLPAQRQLEARWQQYGRVDDVVLLGLDPAVTPVTLSASGTEVQVARGTVQQDADGPRQATLLFKPGTTAELELADGTRQAVGSLGIRATEYTVGANGPRAMPAALPATSGYTYAVELSADEAVAAGARHVHFSRPVAFYVENFLEFPVGIKVPVAYYDARRTAWIPMEDGRVVRIVSTDGGVAALDVSGDGAADGDSALATLGIDGAERTRLAATYAAGTQLWRVQTTHFSPMDLNFPAGPESGDDEKDGDADEKDKDEDDPECKDGSIIECANQVLGEAVAIAGTGLSLNYRSSRVPARAAGRTITVQLTGDTITDELRGLQLEIQVAGQRFYREFDAAPNLSFEYTWDGLDAYGRPVQGTQPARVRIGYVYPQRYMIPSDQARSFGLTCSPPNPGWAGWQACFIPSAASDPARAVAARWKTEIVNVGTLDARAVGLGGWTLSNHHVYEATGHVLYRGDGGTVAQAAQLPVARRVVGTGVRGFSGDGGPADQAQVSEVKRVAFGPDGSMYFADFRFRVRRVSPDGIITTVAGNGTNGFSGDGGPAVDAQICIVEGIAVAEDGTLYLADAANHRIRKVTPDGIITTVAGIGGDCSFSAGGYGGDGGPATQARLNYPNDVVLAPDGTLFISDGDNSRIRRVGPDGIITTYAGTGVRCNTWPCGDGGAAVRANFSAIRGIALGPDGSLYAGDYSIARVRRITPDGIVNTYAGTGIYCSNAQQPVCGDGLPATQAQLTRPVQVDVDAEGTLYIADSNTNKIRVVAGDGRMRTLAGSGGYCASPTACGDGGPAAQAGFADPGGVQVAPDGSVYVADASAYRITRLGSAYPDVGAGSFRVAAADGGELFDFDASGRHLRTTDARTGTVVYRFAYDAAGRLESATDQDGRVTRIERDAAGDPVRIVAPYGQVTELEVDAAGYLARVTGPAGDSTRFAYAVPGLLTSRTTARGHTYLYGFDAAGQLVRAEDPLQGVKTLAATMDGGVSEVAFSSPLGRTDRYAREELPNGSTRSVHTDPSGLRTTVLAAQNGVTTTTMPDGTMHVETSRPDPRLGMQAGFVGDERITTPGGRAFRQTQARRVVLGDPANPLSLQTQTDSLNLNGRIFTSVYDAGQRTTTRRSAQGRETVSVTDSAGRMVETRAAGITPTTYGYDADGRLNRLSQGARSWTLGYDARGKLSRTTDPLGRTEHYQYDDAGRLSVLTRYDGREIRYAYDRNGNQTSVSPPGRAPHLFAFTALDQRGSYTPPAPDSGTWGTLYRYNADGQLEQVTRPDGRVIGMGYDAGGRLSTLTTPDGQTVWGYDPVTGALRTVTAGANTLALTWDGTLPLSIEWSGEVSGRVAQSYDNNFWVTGQTVNGAHAVDYRYDGDGLLTGVGALGFARNAQNGVLTGTTLGQVATTLAYSGYGELAADTARVAGTVVLARTYVRDDMGRITALTETAGTGTTTYAFAYDSVGRLREVTRDGTAVESYEYDANGNRTRAVTQGALATATVDAQDRLVQYGGATYAYNAAGELELRVAGADSTRYRYDVHGNLREVRLPGGRTIDYVADPLNRRVGKRMDGVLVQGFLYQNQLNPVAELDAGGNVVSRFVYGSRPNVPEYMVKGGRTYRMLSDHLGSVRLVVDVQTGAVAQIMSYDSWGNVIEDSNPGFQPFGFAGGLYDRDTGLTRYGARDYDARTGRWTSKDPIRFRSGDTNLYGYAVQDPVNLIDPDGRIVILPIVVGFLAGATMELISQSLFQGLNSWNCLDGSDIFLAGLAGAAGGSLLSAGTKALRAGKAVKTLSGQAANTANRAAKLEGRIRNHTLEATDGVLGAAGIQGGKEMLQSMDPEPNPARCHSRSQDQLAGGGGGGGGGC